MFKGRVKIYKNENGRENTIDREFDNPEEFNQFLKDNEFSSLPGSDVNMSLGNWARLHDYFENLLDRRLGIFGGGFEGEGEGQQPLGVAEDVGIDLSEYEKEARKIDEEKQHKQEKLTNINNTLERLKKYKEKFQNEGKQDLVKKVDEDIKKVEQEKKNLEKAS